MDPNTSECPNCFGEMIPIELDARSVFSPLPPGWSETVVVFRCDCGWTSFAPEGNGQTQAEALRDEQYGQTAQSQPQDAVSQ